MKGLYWTVHRAYRRAGKRLIERLIRHFKWHNTILGTDIPNVRCLTLESITMRNQYGQRIVRELTEDGGRETRP